MCLIFTHHPETVLDEGWIGNFYWHNPDGIGVMSADADEDGNPTIKIEKFLPRNAEEAWAFYQGHIQGKECVVHFRMATHGDTDLSQTHPYIIAEDRFGPTLAFCHNGILSGGNAADRSKSDTWHFNENWLKPMLNPEQGGYPPLALKQEFATILGDYIGDNNRLVFMDFTGHTQIVNEDTGVYWRGMWLANTYAWDAPSHVFAARHKVYSKNGVTYSKLRKDETHDDLLDVAPPEHEVYGRGNDYWWENYRSGNTTAGFRTGTASTGSATNNGVVAVPSTGTTTPVTVASNDNGKEVARADIPFGHRGIGEWKMDQFDSMFNMLKTERRSHAWAQLSYKDLDNFEDVTDLDQLWDAICMCVDGVIDENRLIDVIKHPSKWVTLSERSSYLGKGERTDDDESGLEGEPVESSVYYPPSDEEVIEATLPRKNALVVADEGKPLAAPLMPAFDDNGRPVYNNRSEV